MRLGSDPEIPPMPDAALAPLRAAMRRAASAPIWAAGEKLAAAGVVTGLSEDEDEVELRVAAGARALEVALYPDDEEWSCTCDHRGPICEHAVGALLALVTARAAGGRLPEGAAPASLGHVRYAFATRPEGLSLERLVVPGGDAPATRARLERLRVSLTAASVGRAKAPEIVIDDVDLDVERVLGRHLRGRVPRHAMPGLLRALERAEDVTLDGEVARTSRHPVGPVAVVEGDPKVAGGYRLRLEPDPAIDATTPNGAARCGDTLRPMGDGGLGAEELQRLARGRTFGPQHVAELVTQVLPALRAQVPVEARGVTLPGIADEPPRVVVKTDTHEDRLVVQAQLVYGGEGGEDVAARVVDGQLVVTGEAVPMRDERAEERLAERLRRELGLVVGRPAVLDGEGAVQFASKLALWESNAGAADRFVEGTAHAQFHLAAPIEVDVDFGEDGDAFEVRFASPGGRASAGRVMAAFQRGSALAPLDDGGWAPIPVAWLREHGRLVADLLDAKEAARDGELPKAALPDLARLAEALDRPKPPSLDGLEALVQGFRGLEDPSLPGDLTATLRPYQHKGVSWLGFLAGAGLGGLLADDMGLGKTLQTLTVVPEGGRTLVVAPTSVLPNWRREAETFRPGLKVLTYHGPKREMDPDADLVLTTYAILRLDLSALAGERWDMVALDEAQAIKNPDSQVARAAFEVDAAFRVALSGTPVENRLDELWSQMHFVNPGLLGGRKRFQERYAKPIADGEAGAARRLRERVRPFILRRLKREVAPDLPPRTDVTRHVELTEPERAVYEAVRAATRKSVVERLSGGGSALEALEALMRLRQACCHPALVPGQSDQGGAPSSKIRELLDALETAASEGHKALVFSQWTSFLDLIEPHLAEAGLTHVRLDGSTRDRQAAVDRFQSEDGPPVMLISLKAGGTGLNLTAADHVFLMDPWWNPAVEDQAADRAHRIGQERPVLVHRMVAQGTVEERILALQEAKRALADAALGETDRAASLGRDDLMALLEGA